MDKLQGLGAISAIALAGYLGMVVYRGNVNVLLTQLGTETGFVKWGISLVVLWFIVSETGGSLGAMLGLLAFIGLALVAGDKFFPAVSKFFNG